MSIRDGLVRLTERLKYRCCILEDLSLRTVLIFRLVRDPSGLSLRGILRENHKSLVVLSRLGRTWYTSLSYMVTVSYRVQRFLSFNQTDKDNKVSDYQQRGGRVYEAGLGDVQIVMIGMFCRQVS